MEEGYRIDVAVLCPALSANGCYRLRIFSVSDLLMSLAE